MKKILLLILLMAGFVEADAQVKPVYLYGNQITTNKSKATSYAIYGKLSDQELWMFKRYDLYDNLLQTGSYSDEMLTTPHGKFTFYASVADYNQIHKTSYNLNGKYRFINQEVDFVNGKEEGKWFNYFPDGNVSNYTEYKAGLMNGAYKEFDKFGIVLVSGNYLNNEKHGEWISQKGTRIDTYENGVLKSTRYVKKNKNIKGEVKN